MTATDHQPPEPGPSFVPDVPEWLRRATGWAWRSLLILSAVAVAVWLLIQVRVVVIPLVLGLLLASVLDPARIRLRSLGVGPTPASLISVLFALLTMIGLGAFVGTQVVAQFDEIRDQALEAWSELLAWAGSNPFGLDGAEIDRVLESARTWLTDRAPELLRGLAGRASGIVGAITAAALTFVYAFFILRDGRRLVDWVRSRLPVEKGKAMVEVVGAAWSTLRRYLIGTAVIAVVDGTIVLVTLLILGVPLALPLATIMFIGAFIPFIGGLVAGTLSVAVALVTNGWVAAVIVAVVLVVTQQLEGDLLAPVVLGQAVDLHPAVVLTVVTGGLAIGGVLGGFLAVPLAAVVAVILRQRPRYSDGSSGVTT